MIGVCVLLPALARPATAFDVVTTIRKIDVDQGVVTINANGKDHVARVARNAKIVGADGKDLADGLRARELKEGVEATVIIDREGDHPLIKAIRLGK